MAQQRQRRFSESSSAFTGKHVWTTAANNSNNSNSSTTSPVFSTCNTATTGGVSSGTLDLRRRRTNREIQVVKTLVSLVVLFLAMWAPIFVVFVLISRDAQLDVFSLSSQAFLIAMCIGYCNAVVNPLAYGLSTGKLRGYLKRVITCRSRATSSHQSPLPASHGGAGSVGGGGGGVGNTPGRSGGQSSRLVPNSGGTSIS